MGTSLYHHIQLRVFAKLAGKARQGSTGQLFASRLAFWLQTQVTGKARWPLSCAGLGHGRLALPLSWHACQGWNVPLHTKGDYVSMGDLSSVAMSMSVSSRESLLSGSITQSVFVLLK